MRLFLLPISSRRTLIYCQRLNVIAPEQLTLLDKGTSRAAKLWASWEKKESGWQKKVVDYGNQALKRIPYEEWGLKSIPPLSARRRADILASKEQVQILYPSTLIPDPMVNAVLRTLSTERQSLHKTRMLWCFVGMPLTIPFALIPMYVIVRSNDIIPADIHSVPNIPFFYLVFRVWSHWRALSGSKHIQFLLDNKLVAKGPSQILDGLYSTAKSPYDAASVSTLGIPSDGLEEKMVLSKSDGQRIAEALDVPGLDVELGRAVWQIERSLMAEKELREEKEELDAANPKPREK